MPESGGNDNFWNALITAGVSMYGSQKKKKEENKQLDWMNSILDDKRRYEQEKVDRYKSSPGAQMSPMIMQMLVEAYSPKFKKYGINMPLDKMLAAINGPGPEGGGGQFGGGGASAGYGPSPQRSLSQIANGEEPQAQRSLADMISTTLGNDAAYTQKTGVQVLRGQNPGIGSYNGKTWESSNSAPESGSFGTSAYEVGGPREGTRSMGDFNSRKGDLATGGKVTYTPPAEKPGVKITGRPDDRTIEASGMDYDNWDPNVMSPEDIMAGVSSGDGPDKDTILEKLSRFLDKDGFLPSMVRGLGNVVVPGGPGALDSALEFGINRGWGDGIKGNAGITRTGNRKRGGKWG